MPQDHSNSSSAADLEEENRTLREELTKREKELSLLRNSLTGLHLPSSSGTSRGQFASKFANEFSVSGILGIGGGGCVFEAINLLDEWKYAVKRIAVDPDTGSMRKMLREVRAMAQLDHPGIIRYNSTWIEEPPDEWQYDADEEILKKIGSKKRQLLNYEPNCVFIYIQMQLCNYSLSSWLSENATPESRSLHRMKSWFRQMVGAVEYIHSKNLIHRDLKPGNILFVESDRLKICDLGLVVERKMEGNVEITMTRTGSSTEEYASPEQASVNLHKSFTLQVNAKSDVFTLGLIFAELCVVMDYDKKVKIFDNYRRGRSNDATFTDERTAEFVAWLTEVDKKKRPTCHNVLDHLYMA